MAFATAAELETRWRPLSTEETTRAEVLLEDAAWWLKVWFSSHDLAALAAGNAELATGLEMLSCAMVRRAMTSGGIEGAQSSYQVMGPFSTQVAFRNPDGGLYILARERDAIWSLLGGNVSGAVSMTGSGM